jgi:hypothetical protein
MKRKGKRKTRKAKQSTPAPARALSLIHVCATYIIYAEALAGAGVFCSALQVLLFHFLSLFPLLLCFFVDWGPLGSLPCAILAFPFGTSHLVFLFVFFILSAINNYNKLFNSTPAPPPPPPHLHSFHPGVTTTSYPAMKGHILP